MPPLNQYIESLPGLVSYLPLNGDTTDVASPGLSYTASGLSYAPLVVANQDDEGADYASSTEQLYATIDGIYGNDFSIGCLFRADDTTAGDTLISMCSETVAGQPFWTLQKSSIPTGRLRFIARHTPGNTLVDETISHPSLGGGWYFVVLSITSAGAYTITIDGVVVLTGSYTMGTPPTVDRFGIGCRRQNGEVTLPWDGTIGHVFVRDQVTTLEESQEIQRRWCHYGRLDDTNGMFIPDAATHNPYYKVAVDLPDAKKLAIGMVIADGSSVNLNTRIDNAFTGTSTTLNNDRIFGRLSYTTHIMAGHGIDVSAGFHTLSIFNASQTAGVQGLYIAAGKDEEFVGDVANGYSRPRACYYGGSVYVARAAIFSDHRYITKYNPDGTKETTTLAGGNTYINNDVNHAGAAVIATQEGVLAITTGHSSSAVRCDYFPSGDLNAKVSYTLDGEGYYSYPSLILLPDGKVFCYFRGTHDGVTENGSARHHAVTMIFDPTDGSEYVEDTFVTTGFSWNDASLRCYIGGLQGGYDSNGDYCVGVFWESRAGNTAGQPKFLAAAIYNYDTNQWYNLEGDTLGSTTNGTPSSPRISQGTFEAAQGSGGCMIRQRPAGNLSLTTMGQGSAAFDFSASPAATKMFAVYIDSPNADPQGDYDLDCTYGSLTVDGSTITDHGVLELPRRPMSPFSGGCLELRSDGSVRILACPITGLHYSEGVDQLQSPYWIGWHGGDSLFVCDVTSPFTSSPSFGEFWEIDSPGHGMANVTVIDGWQGHFTALRRDTRLPTLGRRTPVTIDTESGRVYEGVLSTGPALDQLNALLRARQLGSATTTGEAYEKLRRDLLSRR